MLPEQQRTACVVTRFGIASEWFASPADFTGVIIGIHFLMSRARFFQDFTACLSSVGNTHVNLTTKYVFNAAVVD